MTVLKKDPFYSGTGYEDYYRMPLIKPYEMDAISRRFESPGVCRTGNPIIPDINKYAVYNKFFIAKIKPDTDEADRSIFDGYLIVDLRNKNIPSLTRSGEINYEYNSFSERAKYLKHPADINIKDKPDNSTYKIIVGCGYSPESGEIVEKFLDKKKFLKRTKEYGFDELISRRIKVVFPDGYKSCMFFDKASFEKGLMQRGIPLDIKLMPPDYYWELYAEQGFCPWFTQIVDENPTDRKK